MRGLEYGALALSGAEAVGYVVYDVLDVGSKTPTVRNSAGFKEAGKYNNSVGTKGGSTPKNPYSYLKDGPNVGQGKDFTATQKQKMLQKKMKRNGGVVKPDNPDDFFDV